tara:strand:- start:287 stop:763 length:477 start_codon:yes stop_codon:yes gene_type:complete
MENTMTINLHATKEFWEDKKVGFIARAKELAEKGDEEIDALNSLLNSSGSLAESVEHCEDLLYGDLVNFVRAANLLSDDSKCDPFGDNSADRILFAKQALNLAYHIQRVEWSLTLPQVETFGQISYRIHLYLQCKPNKHQMDQFTAHGIEWDGDVRAY